LAPLIVGLVLSVLMTGLVVALFRGQAPPAARGVESAGVLDLAWLFARAPADYRSLVDVDVPTERALRAAGNAVLWKGAEVSDEWEMGRAGRDESPAKSRAENWPALVSMIRVGYRPYNRALNKDGGC
jgi:hypothetical protein